MGRTVPGETTKYSRPIRTERDYIGATASARRIIRQPHRQPQADSRLKSLILQMDEYEDDSLMELDEVDHSNESEGYDGPRRRWADGAGED